MKGVGSIRSAMFRGGLRLSGGGSSASAAADAAAAEREVSATVRGRRGENSVVATSGFIVRGDGPEGEKAAATANVMERAAPWIFMFFLG